MSAPAETDPARLLAIAEGFYVRQAVDNIAWIDVGEYALVVDALEEPHLEEEVVAAIQRTLDPVAVRYVLNTHTHYDHVALNAALQRRFGAKVINLQTTPIPSTGRWFEGSRRKVLMLPAGGAHTDEDCVVWVPQDRALFTGDVFGWGLIPLTVNLRDATAGVLLETYERLIEYEAAVVIPGHGPLCGTGELRRWVAYFRWLVEGALSGLAAGRTDVQIAASLPPPDDMRSWWRFVQWKHADSVAKVIKAVRRGRLTARSLAPR